MMQTTYVLPHRLLNCYHPLSWTVVLYELVQLLDELPSLLLEL
jgi:hypothetical protein